MGNRIKIEVLDRRQFVVQSVAAAAMLPMLLRSTPLTAQERSQSFDVVFSRLTGPLKPEEALISIELPDVAENGNTVPYLVTVQSPMTPASYVKTVYVLSTENPQVIVATFHLSPENGKAVVASRMRLAKTQDVVALAELSDGRLVVARKNVTVTIGGCGG